MFNVEATTTPSQPLVAGDLRTHLRLNDQGEDTQLTEFLAAAVERFEDDTRRPVLSTTYRQYLTKWPADLSIVLGRGGVTSVTAVKKYAADGTTTSDVTGYLADLKTAPVRVVLPDAPDELETSAGVPLQTVGYVEFVAGWANAAAVPKAVLVAIKMLAAHWYEQREAYRDSAFEMRTTPDGWARIVARYRLGLSGDWDQ